jgi:F-type H+-transporting ATPase subunit epsilon
VKLRVFVPTATLVDREVVKVIAEATHGSFCLEPRHADYVASLVPGILYAIDAAGEETTLGLDRGVLVKVGDEVLVAVREAVADAPLGELRRAAVEHASERRASERETREAVESLEASLVVRLAELSEEAR